MDIMHAVDDTTQGQLDLVEKKRFDSFRLGKAPVASSRPRSFHGRPRSRNTSISSLSAISVSTSSTSVKFMNDMSPTSVTHPVGPSKRPTSRPTSHHRRQSSVSTRRESAEVMGKALSDLPPSIAEDNINLGDKDSVRRQALWALEGKSSVGDYSKVEIPELGTPEIERRIFEFPSKPSFPPGPGMGFGGGINSLVGKRDSFGKSTFPSSSTKDQLDTLLEEEEEEEEEVGEVASLTSREADAQACEVRPVTISVITPSPAPARHRPVGLSLRPLSLTPDAVVSYTSGNLPTPVSTPRSTGLKSLTLANPALSEGKDNQSTHDPTSASKCNSLNSDVERRRSMSPATVLARRSSISYISSDSPRCAAASLPTPEMTPTSTSSRYRYSASSTDSDLAREPLSSSEQHFLVKQHSALLARIEDLERALSARPRSRRTSYASDISTSVSISSSEPSDEILQLVADLKAERDELKKDVDGWRVRVSDLDKQVGVLANRVDMERREAWVARERVGLLQVEKSSLERELTAQRVLVEESQERYSAAKQELEALQGKCERLEQEVEQSRKYPAEIAALQAELAQERSKREAYERELENAGLLATPTPNSFEFKVTPLRNRSFGFMSVGSESSFTDVESVDETSFRNEKILKAVAEEDEDHDDELARYEEENESDVSLESPDGSSVGSFEELRRSVRDLTIDVPTASTISRVVLSASPSPLPSPSPSPVFDEPVRPTHSRRNSLSKAWTFPKGPQVQVSRRKDSVDRFFGCLEDLDASPPLSSSGVQSDKGAFSSSFTLGIEDDDLPPFLLPSDVGTVVSEETFKLDVGTVVSEETFKLDVLYEEDESEEHNEKQTDEDAASEIEGEEVEGGIRFTFSPPSKADEAPSFSAPCFHEADGAEPAPFTFPQQRVSQESVQQPTDQSTRSPPSLLRKVSTPSGIPRSTRIPSAIPLATKASPPKPAVPEYPISVSGSLRYFTPPSKRGGVMPSCIPHRSPSSPSPTRIGTPTRSRCMTPVTFIPHSLARQGSSTAKAKPNGSNGSTVSVVAGAPSRSCDECSFFQPGPSDMTNSSLSYQLPTDTSPTCDGSKQCSTTTSPSVPSSLFSPRLSLLTNFISASGLPWSPRCNSDSPLLPDHSDNVPAMSTGRKERGFVSKEKQLEALRARMEEERKLKLRSGGVLNL
ncbi:hypothetical protein GLOTRDRAFT_136359 [Gloeophyllum trabeum ATCC 11539]|uniref:Uncharacterized protein n=1 Tax=Gloeophyllum trabeum (strain ATCC 11539 / FP-39264 / Madison 617) TaxID=670483 RepID=S7QJW8_GLOTA|nr:uncharacterized protein GLOTRDRAFT_136359 [Gloeophyllum trabeum ATCC 11539]EPQ59503.1 hypothetical protein GLOTRDRAFT_136359 [Gloeophyllum trabeum ATCC 11539]